MTTTKTAETRIADQLLDFAAEGSEPVGKIIALLGEDDPCAGMTQRQRNLLSTALDAAQWGLMAELWPIGVRWWDQVPARDRLPFRRFRASLRRNHPPEGVAVATMREECASS